MNFLNIKINVRDPVCGLCKGKNANGLQIQHCAEVNGCAFRGSSSAFKTA